MRQLLGLTIDEETFDSEKIYRKKKKREDIQNLHEDKYLKEAKNDMRLKCRLHLEYEICKEFKNEDRRNLIWQFRKLVYIIIFAMQVQDEVQKSRRRENYRRQILGDNPTITKSLVSKIKRVLRSKKIKKDRIE